MVLVRSVYMILMFYFYGSSPRNMALSTRLAPRVISAIAERSGATGERGDVESHATRARNEGVAVRVSCARVCPPRNYVPL